MQPGHHPLRILEAARGELPGAVILLPVVVDHQHSRRVALIDDCLGVLQHVNLILVIHQLDPGVVLRAREHQRVGEFPARREMHPADEREGFLERMALPAGLDGPVLGRDRERAAAEPVCEGLLAPDVAAVARNQQRLRLVTAVVSSKVAEQRGLAVRHPGSIHAQAAPPEFAGLQLELDMPWRRSRMVEIRGRETRRRGEQQE